MARRRGFVEIKFDAATFRRDVTSFAKNQAPFAVSVGLNHTIDDVHDELTDDLPRTFTIRSGWTEKGVRKQYSSKHKLAAHVGSIDEYMAEQTVGATKTGRGANVPVGARPRPKSKTTQGKWPGALIKKGAFVVPGKGGAGLVYKPLKGRKKKGGGRAKGRLKLMWVLARRAVVPERWPLEQTLRRVAAARWVKNVRAGWRKALATKRRR